MILKIDEFVILEDNIRKCQKDVNVNDVINILDILHELARLLAEQKEINKNMKEQLNVATDLGQKRFEELQKLR